LKSYKVVVCDHIHKNGIDLLDECDEIELLDASSFDKQKKLESLKDASALITRSSTDVNEELLSYAQHAKVIVRAGVGVDNVDIKACSKKGIIVMNVPTSNTIAAVELTFTHMLSCVRKFTQCNNELKSNIWNRENWYGTELKDKKLGVIGFGNIGSRVAIRAKAFDMSIVAFDPYISPSKVTSLDMTYAQSFDEILDCDIITIHTPKTEQTANIISKQQIDKMKDGVIIINCARGGLVNEDDLYDALVSKKISTAGIDVYNKEPANNHKLLELDNVSVTPHVGANTIESQKRVSIAAANQIIEALRGSSYRDALNLPIKQENITKDVELYFQLSQKLGFLASKLAHSSIKSISLTAFGDINKYDKALLTFATLGIMKPISDKINYVSAEFIAKEQGIKLEHFAKENKDTFTNKISIDLVCEDKNIHIGGTIFDGTIERIVSIDGFELDIGPKGNMILFKNSDIPGVVSAVSSELSKHNINISDFRMGRNNKKEALAVIVIDEKITPEILQHLSSIDACISVDYIEL